MTPWAPAARTLTRSSTEVTPPEYWSSSLVILRTLPRVSRSGPVIVPSRSTLVRMTPASGRNSHLPTRAPMATGSVSSQPPTAALWSRTSSAARMRPGCCMAHLSNRCGSRTAAVPMTTQCAPSSSSAATVSAERTPPATCSSMPDCSSIRVITGRLLADPRAASRSTTWTRLAQRLDHRLQRVLVLAHDPKLIALDPHIQLARHVLDSLAQVARDVVGDAGVEPDLDLAAALANRLRVVGLEKLGRELAARRLLAQDLERGPGAILAGRLDHDQVVALVVNRGGVLEVESSADLTACLVESVGELGRIELGDHVEGVLRHYWCELKIAFRPTTTAAMASAIPATEEIASSAPMPAVPSSSDSSGGLS